MKTNLKKYAIAFYESVAGLSGRELDKAISRFADYLISHGLAGQLDRFLGYFEEYYLNQQKITKVTVVSPTLLSEKAQKELAKKLETSLDQKVELVNQEDESLIAGLVLRTKDTLLDGSLKSHLETLKRQLVK